MLGENGAGKSTLMGILSGFTVPDRGGVELNGRGIPFGKPFECRRLGIEMVHQHFTLVPNFTVEENLALARAGTKAKHLNVEALARPALDIAHQLGWEIDPGAKARNLPVGAQQRVEILKALSGNAQVLIFDEPTAVLGPDEVQDLFRVLRELKEQEKIVILIAHKLSEVMQIADRVTVLRKGKFIATAPIGEVDSDRLATWMVGEMPALHVKTAAQSTKIKFSIESLTVKGDRGETAIKDVSFEVGEGEILGIGGVDGNGQVELAEALAGIRSLSGGRIRGQGKVGYIPQDRQSDGLALNMSTADNLLIQPLAHHEEFANGSAALTTGPFLKPSAIRTWVSKLILSYSIKVDSPARPAADLSGGNQQKIVVSRVLDAQPELLVAVNPTRGLDIRATAFVHQTIREAQERGAAIVLISTDLDEIAALATRTLFLSRGRLQVGNTAIDLVGGSS